MKQTTKTVIILNISILLLISCSVYSRKDQNVYTTGEPFPVTFSYGVPYYDETARFFGGINISEKSELAAVAESQEYRSYQKNINNDWNSFYEKNLRKIKLWRSQHLIGKSSTTILYPFSGPDVLHPLSFYPDAKDIIMFGLEPAGGIPVAHERKHQELIKYLHDLHGTLKFTLNRTYFITEHMEKKMKTHPFRGITAAMMFFLSKGGYEVLHGTDIQLDPYGKIEYLSEPLKRRRIGNVAGIEIIFRKRDTSQLKRIRYFQLDVSDTSPQLYRFLAHLKEYPDFSAMIKSASYLLHYQTFSRLRRTVLKRCISILQDDTGVPYRSLTRKKWKVTYFGKYHRPLPVFRHSYQPNLEKDINLYSKCPIPFIYGYGFRFKDMTYHLVLAERIGK